MRTIEYKDIEKLHLLDKIRIFGWLSDLLTKENADTTIIMHKDKIKRIKQYKKTHKN